MPTCDLALLVIIDVTIVPCSGKAWWNGTNDPFYGHLSKMVWLMCVEPLVCCRWCPWRLWSPYLWLWWMAMVLHGGMMKNFLKRSSNPQDGPQAHMLNSGWNTWTYDPYTWVEVWFWNCGLNGTYDEALDKMMMFDWNKWWSPYKMMMMCGVRWSLWRCPMLSQWWQRPGPCIAWIMRSSP